MINCDPNSLATQAACYCFGPRESDAAAIWGLCQWASNLACQISWTPPSALASWTDSGGPHVPSNLATFLATADLPTVTSFECDSAGVSSITCLESLPALTNLVIGSNPLLLSIDLSENPNLLSITADNNAFTSIDFTNNTNLTSIDVSHGHSLTTIIGLSSLSNLQSLACSDCDITGTLNLTGLSNLTGLNCSSNANLTTLTLTGCTALTTLDASFCPALTGITGDSTCTALASISISNSGVTSLTLGGAANMTQIDMTFCPVVSFIANALQTITGDILMDVTSLTTITLPNLTTVGNQLALTSSPFAGTLSLPALVSIGSPVVDLQNNTSLVTLAAPNLVTMSSGIACRASTSLANLSLGSYLPSVGTNIDCFDCALATAAIDMILSRCVASAGWGFGGEFVDLSGGTNLSHALWSAAALADEATLVGRGSPATVVSNP